MGERRRDLVSKSKSWPWEQRQTTYSRRRAGEACGYRCCQWVDVVVGALIFSVAEEAMSSVGNEKGRKCRRLEQVQNSHPGQSSGA